MKKFILILLTSLLTIFGYAENSEKSILNDISQAVDLDKLVKSSKMNLLIPSPVEMILRGKALQIQVEISIMQDLLKYQYNNSEKVLGSIYLGRTLAVVSLGMNNMDNLTLGKYFLKIKEGMIALEVPKIYYNMFEGIRYQFENRSISRSDLIEKLDMGFTGLASRLDKEESNNLIYRILQGSSWVQAQNLLARAIKKLNHYQPAKTLLYQPKVTEFIIDNLEAIKKRGKSTSTVNSLLNSIKLYQKATTPDQIGPEEVEIVINETDSFLTRF